VNGDGQVSADDAQAVLQEYVNGLAAMPETFSEEQFKAADVSNDGVLSSDDAQYILQYYVSALAGIDVTWEKLIG